MKISQFLPKGVGVLFPENPYLKTNNPPLPVKKRNPAQQDRSSAVATWIRCLCATPATGTNEEAETACCNMILTHR